MIIRKPYAFLIKNFKKIHILLLILSFYIAYKLWDINSYVNEFMRLGTYDLFGDPITKHINIWLTLSLLVLIIGSGALLILLYYKKKPWKVYLIPIIEYVALMLVLSMIKGFFNIYSTDIEMTDLRLTKDLLLIFMIGQVGSIGIFIMRVFGLDMRKFQFNMDQEFLELSENDREEIEIGLEIDKYSIIRTFKKFYRNLKYFYLEHKKICITILVVLGVTICYRFVTLIFVTNKSYSEGDFYHVNGYTFQINNSYYSDKDFKGDIISEKSSFVIIDITITNNSEPRKIYLENFHIKNSTEDYVTTKKTFAKEFQDLGNPYESTKSLKRGESFNCIIIYKVDKNLKKNRFVLYYQEAHGTLRKIKLNVKDLSTIETPTTLDLGDPVPLVLQKQEENITFEYVDFKDSVTYQYKDCQSSKCGIRDKDFAPNGSKILEIEFSSDVFEAKKMIDFLKNYGKLNYRDDEDEEYVLDIENALSETNYGKVVFLKIPPNAMNAKNVWLDLIVRNKHYIYNLI